MSCGSCCSSCCGGCCGGCGGCCTNYPGSCYLTGLRPVNQANLIPNCPCRGCGEYCGGRCGACSVCGWSCEPVRGYRGGRGGCGGPVCPTGRPYEFCRTSCNCCGNSC